MDNLERNSGMGRLIDSSRTHPERELRKESRFLFLFLFFVVSMLISVPWSLSHAASPNQTIIRSPIEVQITFPV